MNDIAKYFDKIFCINLDHRTDRWAEFEELQLPAERHPATYLQDRFLAFNTSQKTCLEKCKGFERSLILEDDVLFVEDCSHLEQALKDLPDGWECLYLGGNLLGQPDWKRPEYVTDNLFRVLDCWQTQSMVWSAKGVDFMLEHFLVDYGCNMDEWMRSHLLPRGNSYIIAPMITYQRQGYSDIWDRNVNFEDLLRDGNNIFISILNRMK